MREGWLWRTVEAGVLDIRVQSKRDEAVALRFLRNLLKPAPSDRCGQTPILRRDDGGGLTRVEHRQRQGVNHRSEPSHRHTRGREKFTGRFSRRTDRLSVGIPGEINLTSAT